MSSGFLLFIHNFSLQISEEPLFNPNHHCFFLLKGNNMCSLQFKILTIQRCFTLLKELFSFCLKSFFLYLKKTIRTTFKL